MLKTRWVGVFTVVTLLGAVPAGAQVPLEETYEIKAYMATGTVRVGGTLLPKKAVTLTAQLPGRVEYLAGQEGDRFKERDLLVKISDEALRAQLRAAHAQREAALIGISSADMQYRRELVSPGVANHPGGMGMPSMFDQVFSRPMSNMMGMQNQGYERYSDIQSRYNQIEQARTTLLQADANISQIEEKLRDVQGVAPFAGVITRKLVEVGDPVQPGQALLEFADMAVLQLQADVPARLISGLQEGSSIQARIDDGVGTQMPVMVAQIFPKADEVRHTIRVKFDLSRSVGTAGMYAEVLLTDPEQKNQTALAVPSSALVWRSGLPQVFVVQDGKTELRLLRVGDPVAEGLVAVLSGLSAGDRVIKNPKPGMGASE